MLAEVGRPRLASVGGDAHSVPATTRYADQLTDGALALRLEAVRRLGIASTSSRYRAAANARKRV
jgi:hypothetical protein